jgi:hypothetical protein
VSADGGSCYLVQQQMSNKNRGIIDPMVGQRARVPTIFDVVTRRVVPPGVGPSGPAHPNGRPLVDAAHYRTAGATPSNKMRS